MQRIVDLDKHLDSFGPVGSMSRLKEIARLNLGVRSEAAKKVIKSRELRIKAKNSKEFDVTIHLFGKSFKAKM